MIIDKIHKLPGVRALLCALGRHEYETEFVGVDEKGHPWAQLYCFYCMRGKRSWSAEWPSTVHEPEKKEIEGA